MILILHVYIMYLYVNYHSPPADDSYAGHPGGLPGIPGHGF